MNRARTSGGASAEAASGAPARGRRPGPSGTRTDILLAARTEFAAAGFDKATVRRIASAAGVDPAMIHHHFGSKQDLFSAALTFTIHPAEKVAEAVPGPRDRLGERLVHTLLTIWDTPAGDAAVAVLRTAVGSEPARTALRDFAFGQIAPPIRAWMDVEEDERDLRIALVMSQLLGLIFARYVFEVGPLVEARHDDLVDSLGSTVQGYLTGPLDHSAPPR